VTGEGPRRPSIKVLQVRLSVGSTLLVIGAVATALVSAMARRWRDLHAEAKQGRSSSS
jgi:hypothetical protein